MMSDRLHLLTLAQFLFAAHLFGGVMDNGAVCLWLTIGLTHGAHADAQSQGSAVGAGNGQRSCPRAAQEHSSRRVPVEVLQSGCGRELGNGLPQHARRRNTKNVLECLVRVLHALVLVEDDDTLGYLVHGSKGARAFRLGREAFRDVGDNCHDGRPAAGLHEGEAGLDRVGRSIAPPLRRIYQCT
jgi:hypothetical protein